MPPLGYEAGRSRLLFRCQVAEVQGKGHLRQQDTPFLQSSVIIHLHFPFPYSVGFSFFSLVCKFNFPVYLFVYFLF